MKQKGHLLGVLLLTGLGASLSSTAQTNYFTEYFSGENVDTNLTDPFDLGGLSMTLEPVGGADHYAITSITNIAALPFSTAGKAEIDLSIWPYYTWVTVDGGRSVKLYGETSNTIYIWSSGFITFDDLNSKTYAPDLTSHFNGLQISPHYAFLAPWDGGKVTAFEAAPGGTPIAYVVTFEDVPSIYDTNALCTFQCTMYYTGIIRMSWLNNSFPYPVLVGLSKGEGYPLDFQEIDFSEYDPNDMDGDGLPDLWEAYYFGSYTNCDPHGHGDADNFDNESEYIAGTDPTDASDYFRVLCSYNGSQSNPGIILDWNCVTGRTYTVKHTDVLISPLTPMATNIVYPQSSYTVPIGSGQNCGFFNISVQMTP